MQHSKVEVLCFGYIRLLESKLSLLYSIPSGIVNVIILYYPIEYKFINRGLGGYTISNNGSSLEKSSSHNYVVQFGEFFSNKLQPSFIWTITFKWISGNVRECAFGFITKQFDGFNNDCCNWGDNNSMSVAGNGYMVTSSCFNDDDDLTQIHKNGYLWTTEFDCHWFKVDDLINIKINTKNMTAIIWNATNLNKNDLNYDEIDHGRRP